MKRSLAPYILKDLPGKIILLTGPRQVGKTTLSKSLTKNHDYLNHDAGKDRNVLKHQEWDRSMEIIIFDELHKMKKWKSWLKGVYDTETRPPGLVVTGSARLDVYRKGGDSLAGRHFTYRLLPFTVKELKSQMSAKESLNRLMTVGGFPEPFLKNSEAYATRWRKTHVDIILRQDLLDLEKVRDIRSIEILIDLLRHRVGSTTSYSSLGEDLQVSVHTVKHWLQILENLYVIFPVRPYSKNISRSILKDTKYYFYDTGAVIGDESARLENTIANALLAELHFHEDTTGTKNGLYYLRDKEKREIDFLILIGNTPRLMVEVKLSDNNFSKNLAHFQSFFRSIATVQVVHYLDRPRSSPTMRMISTEKLLSEIDFSVKP